MWFAPLPAAEHSPAPAVIEGHFLQQISKGILTIGVTLWLSGFAMIGIAMVTSDCYDGPPLYLYAIPVALIVHNKRAESVMIQLIRDAAEQLQSLSPSTNSLGNVVQSFDRLTYLDSPRVLLAFGCAVIADFVTDHFQAVQAYKCDARIQHQYSESWRALTRGHDVARYLHLWYLFAAMLCIIYIAQGIRGFSIAFSAWKMSTENTNHSRLGSVQYENMAVASEWAGALSLSRLLRECAAACAASEVREKERGTEEEDWPAHFRREGKARGKPVKKVPVQRARERSMWSVIMRSVIMYVLLENAPSMFLTAAFFAIQFDHLTILGKVKSFVSFTLSVCGALSKAKDAIRARTSCSIVVGVAIIVLVLLALGKMIAVPFCASHFFSYVTWKCVKVVAS